MSYILAGVLWNDDGTMATKELTPLDALKSIRCALSLGLDDKHCNYEKYNNLCDIIETTLKRLEKYEKNATFTMVNQINALRDENEELRKRLNAMYELREQYHLDQKKLKALEIIKEKTLTINDLYWLKNGDYKEYRKNLEVLYSGVEEEHLQKILKTKEEYDLLKEVLYEIH